MFIKSLSVVLCVVMALTAAPLGGFVGLDLPSLFDFKVEAVSYSGTCGDNVNWSLDTETGVLNIYGTGAMKSWSSDSSVPWYSCRSNIKTVNIARGVTSIGYNAFYNCSSLESVTIPDSVTSIAHNAFFGCSSLESVTIPDSVTSIGSDAFYNCSSLASVTIPDSVTSIGNYAFYGCSSLASVTIPDSVTSIGYDAFYGCSSLESVTIPDSVTSIGYQTFRDCTSLTSITIPDSVTSIGSEAFRNCSSLASVTIPDGVTSIGYYAFSGCSKLVLELKKGSYAETYANDNSIIYCYIYDGSEGKTVSVTVTAKFSFEIDKETQTMTVNCSGNMLSFTDGDAPWMPYKAYIRHIIINDGCTSISDYSFINMGGVKSITIPDSVTSIGNYAFYGCSSLESVTIPDSVTSIGSGAFEDCTSLTSITIPDSVTSIGEYAFSYCSSLASVTIPDSVTSIGDSAFYYCSSLASVTIPVSANINNAFISCSNIKKITLTKGSGTVQSYSSVSPWNDSRNSLKELVVEDGVTGIGDYMFYNCAEIGDIVLPFSVESIGTNAFAGCQKLGKLKVYNRNCVFESNATSYYTTIVGYSGSTAEAYANENGFSFEPISDDDHDHTYSNSCDNECNICGYIDPDRSHSFDNGCDPDCDVCGYIRSNPEHKDENADGKCDMCETYISDIQVGVAQNVKVDAGKTILLKFVPYQSGVYTFTASSSSDTYGYIYDADKKQLASNDDDGEGNNFLITYTLKRETVYYLGVRFYNSSASGEIPVKITLDQIICDHIKTHTEHMDSTCSQEGYDKVICDDCGETVSTTVIATIPHTYKTIVAEPTCVDEGVVVCLCSACRYAYIDEILDPLGHSEPVWKTVVKPTTAAEGTMNYVCPACDEVFDTKSIPAIALSGNSTAVVDFTTNTITGFDAGSTELDDYLSATNNGYVFTCLSETICTGAVVELTDGETLINSYTVVIFGDIDGDGWYDANDAFLVNMIANGLISADSLSEAQFKAADCNHDGVVDSADFYLLNQASIMLDDIDQSATQQELTTSSVYISYCSLIDQTAGEETHILPIPETQPESDSEQPTVQFDLFVFINRIFELFKKLFTLLVA